MRDLAGRARSTIDQHGVNTLCTEFWKMRDVLQPCLSKEDRCSLDVIIREFDAACVQQEQLFKMGSALPTMPLQPDYDPYGTKACEVKYALIAIQYGLEYALQQRQSDEERFKSVVEQFERRKNAPSEPLHTPTGPLPSPSPLPTAWSKSPPKSLTIDMSLRSVHAALLGGKVLTVKDLYDIHTQLEANKEVPEEQVLYLLGIVTRKLANMLSVAKQ